MGGVASAEPDALDELARTSRSLADGTRGVHRRVDRALLALGPLRDGLGDRDPVRSLRTLPQVLDDTAGTLTRAAVAFRAADGVLHRLGVGAGASGGSTRRSGPPVAAPPDPDDRSITVPWPDASVEWQWPLGLSIDASVSGDHASARVDAGVGLRASADAGVDVTREVVRAAGELEASAGAWARAAVAAGLGPLVARAEGELFAGAAAGADAGVFLGRNGARAHGGVEAFAGVRATGEVRAELGPVSTGVTGHAQYGIGGHADIDAELTWERMRLKWDVAAALGVGLGLGHEVSIEPRALYEGLVDLGDSGVEIASGALDAGESLLDDTIGRIPRFGL
jgi:hypothetical protein